jgi:hypothetical protein
MATPLQTGQKDVSLIVWIGVIGLLFLAVAVHEGWFASGAGDGGDGQGVGGVSSGGVTGDYGDTGFAAVNSLSSFWNYLTTF